MSIEDRITSTLRGELDTLDPRSGDLDAVRRAGGRIRTRRRVLAGGAAAVVLALVATGGLLARGDDQPDIAPAPASGRWERLPDLPLAPRANPVMAWTGSEVLVIGGYLTVCPAGADCANPDELARDGAAYDPASGKWHAIADAPVELADYFRSVMVGDTLVLFDGQQGWFAYDVGDDEWRTLPGPQARARDMGALTADAPFVYALGRSGRIFALDLELDEWGEYAAHVPEDIQPQTLVWTHQGLVVSGTVEGSDRIVAALVDGGRTMETGQLTPFRHYTGERLVELDLQPGNGGALDPATGQWEPLPDQPSDSAGGDDWWPVAADGPLLAGWGYVYDDSDRSWTRLSRPTGAVAEHGYGAVWADGRLIVVDGADQRSDPVSQAWSWSPE